MSVDKDYCGSVKLNGHVVVFVVDMQAYLEDFYDFCQTLGDTTAEVMSEALAVSSFRVNFGAIFFPQ